MEDFYLELDGGQLKMIKDENNQIRFEVMAYHLEEPNKITSITFLLGKEEIDRLGEWIKNAGL